MTDHQEHGPPPSALALAKGARALRDVAEKRRAAGDPHSAYQHSEWAAALDAASRAAAQLAMRPPACPTCGAALCTACGAHPETASWCPKGGEK